MKIEIYLPTKSKGTKVLRKSYRKTIEAMVAEQFGGCTTVKGKGNWIDRNGLLISETVYVITAYCDETKTGNLAARSFVRNLAMRVKFGLSQDCVLITIDNKSELI